MEENLLKVLKQRREAGHNDDGNRIALFIEGGGLKGVVTAGMIAELHEQGFERCFDEVHGSSAGALCAAMFASGAALTAERVFLSSMGDRDYWSYSNMLSNKPVLNLKYLTDHVMPKSGYSAERALSDPAAELHFMTTDAFSFEGRTLSGFDSPTALNHAMRASMHVPILAGMPPRIDDAHHIDGDIGDPLPVRRLMGEGATHVMCLRSKPDWYHAREDRPDFDPDNTEPGFLSDMVGRMGYPFIPPLHAALKERAIKYDRASSWLSHGAETFRGRVMQVAPRNMITEFGFTERDRTELVQMAGEEGHQQMNRTLGGYELMMERFKPQIDGF